MSCVKEMDFLPYILASKEANANQYWSSYQIA